MFCGNCGSKVSDNNNFCIKCGKKIEKEDTVSIEENTSSNEVNIDDEVDNEIDSAEDEEIVEAPVVPDEEMHPSLLSHFVRYECQYCKSKINRGATTCKKCGRTMTKEYLKSENKSHNIILVLALISALGFMAFNRCEDKKETNENSTHQTSKEEKKDKLLTFYIKDIRINSDFAERTKEYSKFISEIEVTYSKSETNFTLRHIGNGRLTFGIFFNNQNRIYLRESLIQYTNIYNSYTNGSGKAYVSITNIKPVIFAEMADGVNTHDNISDNKSEIYFEDGIFVIKFLGTHEPFDNMFFIDYENATKFLRYLSDDWIKERVSYRSD